MRTGVVREVRVLRTIRDRLVRTHENKRACAAVARAIEGHLKPGVWFLPYAGTVVHWRSGRLPDHLRRTKFASRSAVSMRFVPLLRAFVPPFVVVVPLSADATRPGAPPRAAGILLVAPHAPTVVVVEPGRSVTRLSLSGRVPVRILAIRRAMQPFVPMPAFAHAEDRRSLRDAFLDGVPLWDASAEARDGAFRSLLSSYADLVRADPRRSRPARVEAAFPFAATEGLPEEMRDRLRAVRAAVLHASATWPCVPSNGDVWSENIIVADGEPHLIDFELADLMPFFYDIVMLVLIDASYGRHDLLDGIAPGGIYREEWEALWRSAGAPGAPRDLELVGIAVTLLYASSSARRKGLVSRSRLIAAWLRLLPTRGADEGSAR